jgi:hypothetical protein
LISSDPLPRHHIDDKSCGVSSTRRRPIDRLRLGLSLGLFVLGTAVVCRLVARVGLHSIVALLGSAGPGAAFVFAAPVVGQFLNLLAWTVLLPHEARPDPLRGYRLLLAAQAGNELGASVLGESLKVIALPSRHRDAAVAAVVLDNVVCFAAVCGFLVVGGAGLWPSGSMSTDASHVLKWAPLIVAAVMVPFVAVGSVRRSARSAVAERLNGIVRACRLALRERPRAIAAAFLLHLAAKLWVFAEFWLAIRLFGHGSLRQCALLGVASVGGSMIGAPVPAQLGVVESAVALAAATAGIPTPVALAVLVLRRVRAFFWILAGALSLPATKGGP